MLDGLSTTFQISWHPSNQGVNLNTDEEETRPASDEEPFAALAFQRSCWLFVGRLTFFHVYSGVLQSEVRRIEYYKGGNERIGRILQMHANSRKKSTLFIIVIAAAVGLKDTTTGDSLTDEKAEIIQQINRRSRTSYPIDGWAKI